MSDEDYDLIGPDELDEQMGRATALAQEQGGVIGFMNAEEHPDLLEPVIVRYEKRSDEEHDGNILGSLTAYPLTGGPARFTLMLQSKDMPALVEPVDVSEQYAEDE